MQNEELRRAETALDAARDRYFDLYDLAPVGYCTLSKEGLVLEANLTAATLLGVPRGAMVKQPISLFIHPEDMDLFYLHRQRLLEAGDTLAWDLRMVKKDGTAFWGHLEAGVAQDAEGEDVIRLVVSDVTERVWAARAQAFLAKAEWLTSGEGFFQALARFLADDLGMDYVCIDRLAGDYLEAETLAIWFDGHFEDNVTYALKDTPCGDVVGKSICCFPSGVRHRFPKDQVLQDMTAESYLGVTLWGAKGQPIGLIALIGRHAMADTDLAKTTLDLVSLRAAAELERHQAEEALRESEGKLTALFEALPVGISVLNTDRRITYVNPALAGILGLSKEQLLTGDYRRRAYLHDDGTPMPEDEFPSSRALREEQAIADVEIQVLKEGGTRMWLSVSATPLNVGDWRVINTSVDITDRKLAEDDLNQTKAILQAAMDQSPVGIAIADAPHGNLRYVNQAGVLMRGGELDTILHGVGALKYVESWRLLDLDGRPLEALEVPLARAVLLGEPSTREFMIHREDGEHVTVRGVAAPIRNADGVLVSAIVVFEDISQLKRAESARQLLEKQLQQSQKLESLGTLAGGVAHDMNNVLGAILGLASAHIGSQPYGSPLHQALDTICKATERGGKMVKSLLGFARQSPAENNRLDMNAILKEQVGFLERTTLAKVRLQMDLEAGLRPIQGDASALTHAFMNLCVNAVDAMPENGTLTLHTRNVDNDWIEIEVEDNGRGMSKEVLEKALDPFFTTKGIGKGTGLGLSMVFSTVKAHRGQMAIESEPNKGTRVRMRFPACKNEIQVAVTVAADATNSHHRSLKVLLVDDDDLIQSSVQAILEVLGHTAVNTAMSGEEALALLEAGLEPDLVILDMNMPGLGGYGTLPRLRGLRPVVPVLLSTGRADETALALADAYPGVTLLSKPFGLRELQKHLENIGLG